MSNAPEKIWLDHLSAQEASIQTGIDEILYIRAEHRERFMNETKFTPGPWAITQRGGIGPRLDTYDQSHGMVMEVAYIENFDWPDNHEANASLIAAAPDLYEALANLENDDESIPAHAWEMVQAALAKARGESDD